MARVASKRSFGEVERLPAYHRALPAFADAVSALCADGDAAPRGTPTVERPTAPVSVFDSSVPADVSVKDYLVRMCKYAHCSRWVFICMAVLLDRYRRAKGGARLTSRNVHRLLLTVFVVAAKMRDDVYYANKYYASIGGVSLRELNGMERAFLTSIDWDLHVDAQEHEQCVKQLLARQLPDCTRQRGLQPQPTTSEKVSAFPTLARPPHPYLTFPGTSVSGKSAAPLPPLTDTERVPDIDDHSGVPESAGPLWPGRFGAAVLVTEA